MALLAQRIHNRRGLHYTFVENYVSLINQLHTPILVLFKFRYRSYLDRPPIFRIRGPNLKNTNGIGSKATQTNANSDVAQSMPRASYIWIVNSGKHAPTEYRRKPFAATADAPPCGP